jgi:SWI/SNF-related matrix-associated actin-dependent regulator of chromatin subfamily A member 5
VLLPKSTLGNWGNEFKTFCPSMRVLRLHGEKEERVKLVQEQLQPGIPQVTKHLSANVSTAVRTSTTALTTCVYQALPGQSCYAH